ncbi:MAG: response regulator [Acidobacteria bacterium]|nr:response regulator [Acidobacteriota bacterium]
MTPGPRPSAHLLVVDDVEMNRDMLSRRLRSRGYTVSLADSGYAALERIAEGGLDAVLLDVMMPGLTGLDVLREVRKTISASQLPVIMATARDQSEDIVEALKLGANDYVTKPLDFPVVLARLETHLQLKRSQEEIRSLAQQLEVRNQFIRKTFGRYLSDEVVEQILETPAGLSLGGERRRLTILMADLRGFTALSEGTPPETVVHILNRYLGIMARVISEHRGTIDEFIGDAILALFGAPIAGEDDELRACLCAIRMQLAMSEVNRLNEEEGLPRLQIGIALNTGEVVVGNIGSETRSKYGVVGSHVNLTGRIESLTVGGQILMSEETRLSLGGTAEVGWSQEISAKGFRDPISVHELVGLGPPHGLRLPGVVEVLEPLSDPLPVSFVVLHEKHSTSPPQEGLVVALSTEAAEIRSEGLPHAFSDVRLRMAGPEGPGSGADAYGKVLPWQTPQPESFRLRFTSLPASMALAFRRLPRAAAT